MSDLTKNPDLRFRDKPDDFFGDWKWREGLAELMVPIIGKLYRNGVNVLICLLYTSPSPRDNRTSRMPSSA